MKKIILISLLCLSAFLTKAQTLRINKYLVDSMISAGVQVLYYDTTHTGQWKNISQQAGGGGSGSGSGLNIYNSDSSLAADRHVYGQNNTRSLYFDSLNAFNVYRDAINRIYMNNISSGLFSPNGLASTQVSDQVAQLNFNNTTKIEVNDSIRFIVPSGKYSISNLPNNSALKDSVLVRDSLNKVKVAAMMAYNFSSIRNNDILIYDSTNNEVDNHRIVRNDTAHKMMVIDTVTQKPYYTDIPTMDSIRTFTGSFPSTGNVGLNLDRRRIQYRVIAGDSTYVYTLAFEDSTVTYTGSGGGSGSFLTFTNNQFDVTNTANVWTPTTADASFNHRAVDPLISPGSDESRIWFQYVATSDVDSYLGYKGASSAPVTYSDFDVMITVSSSNQHLYYYLGLTGTDLGAAVTGRYYAIHKNADNTYDIQYSTDEISWTTIATNVYSNSGSKYVALNLYGSGKMSYPKQTDLQ